MIDCLLPLFLVCVLHLTEPGSETRTLCLEDRDLTISLTSPPVVDAPKLIDLGFLVLLLKFKDPVRTKSVRNEL